MYKKPSHMLNLRRFPHGPVLAPNLQYYPTRKSQPRPHATLPHVRPFTLTYR